MLFSTPDTTPETLTASYMCIFKLKYEREFCELFSKMFNTSVVIIFLGNYSICFVQQMCVCNFKLPELTYASCSGMQ